ncbi:MAG: HisA/HisF-related TIM barrel protein [Candidatus Hydrothermarchaeaceae archaeon]
MSPFLPHNPTETLELLVNRIKRFIVLSISSVGKISADFSLLDRLKILDVEVYYGGGIKKENINELKKRGVSGVLVGTALHKGLI